MNYLALIESAVRATTFIGDYSFSWFGKQPAVIQPHLRRQLSPEIVQQQLLVSLQQQLYSNFYCRGYARPIRWENPQEDQSGSQTFLTTLANANSGNGYWGSGWLVEQLQLPRVVVSRADMRITVFEDELRATSLQALKPGDSVDVHFPAALPYLSPGYYVINSNIEFSDMGTAPLLRIYWNIKAEGAALLTQKITRTLNAMQYPFRLKLINHAQRYGRCDSAVLYIRQSNYVYLSPELENIARELQSQLMPATPVFSKPLAPGVGLAEDPPGGESFGLLRCGLLAHGLHSAYVQGMQSTRARCDQIISVFDAEKISLTQPYLNPGSVDKYPFDFQPHVISLNQPKNKPVNHSAIKAQNKHRSALHNAIQIGDKICQSACWYNDRCTWLADSNTDPNHKTLSTLGSDIYSGLAGVALFLSELGRRTNNSHYIETAQGAMRQAQHRLHAIPDNQRMGLFTGYTGIALAQLHMGQCLDDNNWIKQAKQLALQTTKAIDHSDQCDLMSGWAGVIVGMLNLFHSTQLAELQDFAESLGDEILRAARISREGVSWRTINQVNEYHLTGFSHGTAGIAYALLKLYEVTGQARFRSVASDALAYEQHWFDANQGNWPDLRESRPRQRGKYQQMAYSSYWCHGAPGISLSRLEAYRILGLNEYKQQALTALNTTFKTMTDSTFLSTNELTPNELMLCHGIIGNADILLSAQRALGDQLEQSFTNKNNVAQTITKLCSLNNFDSMIDRQEQNNQQQQQHPAAHPGLMTGLAGTGWFYLRVIDPNIPSVLNGFTQDQALTTSLSTAQDTSSKEQSFIINEV